MQLSVNGALHEIKSSADTPLLWVLRDELGLTGTKYGCGKGICGACTVHLEGSAIPACTVAAADVQGLAIVTIEGLVPAGQIHPVQQAWLDAGVSQCGYCQPGMIMAVAALLRANPNPTDAELANSVGVQCRCGTYPRVVRAVRTMVGR
jgi:isoquinoline 1-oxidoreductase alpha subunit